MLSQPQLGFGESQMLDKLLYEEEVKRCVICFEQQFHYTPFYAYMKLREQVRGQSIATTASALHLPHHESSSAHSDPTAVFLCHL